MSASLRSESSPSSSSSSRHNNRQPTSQEEDRDHGWVTVTSESLFSHIPHRKPSGGGLKIILGFFRGKGGEWRSRPANVAIISSSSWDGKGEKRRKGPSPTFQAGNMGVEHANSFPAIWPEIHPGKKIRASWRNSGIYFYVQVLPMIVIERTLLNPFAASHIAAAGPATNQEYAKRKACLFGGVDTPSAGKRFPRKRRKKGKLFFLFAPWQNENQIRKKTFELQAKNPHGGAPFFVTIRQ